MLSANVFAVLTFIIIFQSISQGVVVNKPAPLNRALCDIVPPLLHGADQHPSLPPLGVVDLPVPDFNLTAESYPEQEEKLRFQESVRQRNLHYRDDANYDTWYNAGGYMRYSAGDNGRVEEAEAGITATVYRLNMGTEAYSAIQPLGWEEIGVTGEARNRCHLIGKQFGGTGRDARNLFTCHRYPNSPVMEYYERRVADYLNTFVSPGPWYETLWIKHHVFLLYLGKDYPGVIRIKSELCCGTQYCNTLQDVWVSNTPTGNVSFNCNGVWPQTGPSALPTDLIATSTAAC